VLDEAQLTIRLPDQRRFSIGLTAWKNRMIDMYTTVGGIEITHKGAISVMAGAYLGSATLDEVSKTFLGAQLGVSGEIDPADLAGACLLGKIEHGWYRKCGIEIDFSLLKNYSVPIIATFNAEERYFNFGNGGPISQPKDEFVFIAGAELHLENLLN
jgi:hypothetical protein